MIPRSILAITDFSQAGDYAFARAAHLCAEHGAALKLLCVAFPGEPPPQDAAQRLEQHALQLAQRHAVRVNAAGQIDFSLQDLLASARCADLLVWGCERARGVRPFFLGQPVEAMLRQCQRPILVVRRPAQGPYRSLVVAVDFSQASRSLVDIGFALNPGAQVELFHAISTANEGKLRYAEVSEQAIEAYRRECRRYAQGRMFWLTDSYDARRNRVLSVIGHGNPARQVLVQQQRSGAELVVVGRHPASALSDFVFGSTAGRILRDGTGDVLVVPHDHQPASSANTPPGGPWSVRRRRAGAPQGPGQPNPAALSAGAHVGLRSAGP